jgi:ribose transport system substrate-binding protein
MQTRRNFVSLLTAAALLAACKPQGSGGGSSGSGGAKPLKIAVIPKGTTHEFWKAVHAGGVKAAKELGVEIVWKGPLKEDDLKQQIEVVQGFVAQGVSGIVLAPLNDKGLVPAVNDAVAAKVPVVIFDSDLQGDAYTSFVATDNLAAGKLAGERMAKLLDKKGKVVVLRYQEGSASTTLREQGFLDALKAYPDIQVVSENQHGGATTESAFAASESLLVSLKAGEGGVNGVFCPNESTTFGMLLALEKREGLAGKIKFLGFDASDKLVEALAAGKIHGLVVQNPFRMGELAVQTMVKHLRGEKVERRIDTGARIVDKDNMEQPDVKELLKPDLKKWLGE